MDKYTDNAWLDNIALQYEIAMVAHDAMLHGMAAELGYLPAQPRLARRAGLSLVGLKP